MIEVDRVDSAEIDNRPTSNVRVLAARSTSRNPRLSEPVHAARSARRRTAVAVSGAARRSRSGLALGSAAVRAVGAACRPGKAMIVSRPALIGCRKPTIANASMPRFEGIHCPKLTTGRVSDNTWSDTPHHRFSGQDRDLMGDRHCPGGDRPDSRATRHDGAGCRGASALLLGGRCLSGLTHYQEWLASADNPECTSQRL